jgi:hypothetical protein
LNASGVAIFAVSKVVSRNVSGVTQRHGVQIRRETKSIKDLKGSGLLTLQAIWVYNIINFNLLFF